MSNTVVKELITRYSYGTIKDTTSTTTATSAVVMEPLQPEIQEPAVEQVKK